jgi:homoserine O-acetyltransferase/O-succinyltransferase
MESASNPHLVRMASTKWQILRKLTALTAVSLCTIVQSCSSSPQAHDQRQAAAPTVAESIRPSDQSAAINPRQADTSFPNYKFRDGETLPQLRLHYATLGEPHKDEHGSVDNAILLLHWTDASSQALLVPEYKEALFAPGDPFDITRFFVIIPDSIGHGQSSKPSDELKARFPHYAYGDIVDLQHKLIVETLGITHLRAVVGMSMGCMNAWQWAESYPDAMDGIMPVACFPSPINGRNLLWRRMIVDGIKSDPAWAEGNYQQQPPSVASAVEIVQMMIDGVPHLQEEVSTRERADEFIRNAKKQAAERDANDFIYSLESSGDFNAEPDLGKIKVKLFALNFADDEFYRDSLRILQRDMPKIQHGELVIRAVSAGSAGHFSMAHPELWKDQAGDFIGWLNTH